MWGNKNILIIALIAVVNSLGYGIIIPILYSYSRQFGLSDFQNGLLFSVFSLMQFLATPVIGRLSDKYGRKPLLLISLAGTCVSFVMMAVARNSWWLFVARGLDGITAGNLPVAQAVISDTTEIKDRARGFGIMGAAWGFGFVFGPAIAAMTVGMGMAIPFWIAAAVAFGAVLLTALILQETNMHRGEVRKGKLFDFKHLFAAARDERVSKTLWLSLLYSLAFMLFIYAYQPFAVKVLHLSPQLIAASFTLFGVMGFLTQLLLMKPVVRVWGEKGALLKALVGVAMVFCGYFLVRNVWLFFGLGCLLGLSNPLVNPLLQALLSKEVEADSQGSIMGVNASYASLGMIVGPIVGGAVASLMIPAPFLVGAAIIATCWWLAKGIRVTGYKVEAF